MVVSNGGHSEALSYLWERHRADDLREIVVRFEGDMWSNSFLFIHIGINLHSFSSYLDALNAL